MRTQHGFGPAPFCALAADAGGGAAPADPARESPLAPAQLGMVWHEQLVPGSFSLAPLVRRYRGPLDVVALQSALVDIVSRHGSLRTTFAMRAGRAVQRVDMAGGPPPMTDLEGRSWPEQQAEIGRLVDEARRPFDLVDGPLFACRLVRLGVDDHVLVVRVHHAVFDDWSVGVFRRELSRLYAVHHLGDEAPPPPPQFIDIARGQHQALSGSKGGAERAFWRAELSGAPLLVQLPIDDPDRPEGSRQAVGAPVSVQLPSGLSEALRVLARGQRSTLFTVLLAAFATLVRRLTGQDDLLVSTLVANRNRTELEGVIGCFGKKVLVRLQLQGDPSFVDVATRTRQSVLRSLAHPDLAYEAVVQEMLGPGATRHGLAPQVALKFQAAVTPTDRLHLPGVRIEPIEVPRSAPGVHFLDQAEEAGDEAPWGLGLFNGTFLGLAYSEGADGIWITSEGVYHPPAVRRLLRQYRELLEEMAENPQRAISGYSIRDDELPQPDGGAEPPVGASSASGYDVWRAQVARTPDRIALVAGGDRVSYRALDARVDELATRLQGERVRTCPPLVAAAVPAVDLVAAVLVSWKLEAAGEAGFDDRALVDLWIGLRWLGATPAPDQARAAGVIVPPDPAQGAFRRGLVALLDGHTLHVRPQLADGAEGAVTLIGAVLVDVVDCTPRALDHLLDAGLAEALEDRSRLGALPIIRVAVTGPMSVAQWSRLQQLHADVFCLFAPAAVASGATVGRVSGGSGRPNVGRPLAHVTARVLDPTGIAVPRGAVGELHAGRGRLHPTGQLVRCLPGGELQLLGEVEDQVDLGGYRVEPARIEQALATCAGVAEVTVVLRSDDEEAPRLVAYVVPVAGSDGPGLPELRRHLWSQLPGYAWPSTLRLVERLPRAPDGRVDRAALPPPSALVAPRAERGDVEKMLCSAWAEVLGEDEVEAERNYWQSFSFLEAVQRVRQLGLEITPRQVARHRTVEALAIAMEADRIRLRASAGGDPGAGTSPP